MRAEGVLRCAVVVAEPPVEVPDVVAPAGDLADEALDAGERCGLGAVRFEGGVDRLTRIEHPEVHRHAEERVRHRPVVRQRGVLERTEVAEAHRDEVVERTLGFVRRHREATGVVAADEPGGAVPLPPVQVVPHLVVDVVLVRPPRLGQPEGRRTLRRRLAVLVVEAELPADRLAVAQQPALAAPDTLVVVLHAEPTRALGRPLRELVLVGDEPAARQDHGVPAPVPDLRAEGAGRRVDHLEVVAARQCFAEGVDLDVLGTVTEFADAVAQGAQPEVGLRPVDGAGGEELACLDDEGRAAVVERRTVLAGQDQATTFGGHGWTVPKGRGGLASQGRSSTRAMNRLPMPSTSRRVSPAVGSGAWYGSW